MPKLGRVAKAKMRSECVNPRCPDNGTTRVVVHRHHTGCEGMFVRHLLATRPRELWIQQLAARYHAFDPADTAPLCIMCHHEVHQRYLPYIKLITHDAGRRISHFTEAETLHHIAALRRRCARILSSGFIVAKETVRDYYSGKVISNSRSTDQ